MPCSEKLVDGRPKPRNPVHLVEQLSISLDKAKIALDECCTDGTAHAALALALFEQAISKLDETRYMVRRSKEQASREEGRVSNAPANAGELGTIRVRAESNMPTSELGVHDRLSRMKKGDLGLPKDEPPSFRSSQASPFDDKLAGDDSPAHPRNPHLSHRQLYGREDGPTARPPSAMSTRTSSSRHTAAPKGSETFSGIPHTLSPQPLELDDRASKPRRDLRSNNATPSGPPPDSTASRDREPVRARSDRASRPVDAMRDPPVHRRAREPAGSGRTGGRPSSRARSRAPSISSSVSSDEEAVPPPRSRRPSIAVPRRGSVTSCREAAEGHSAPSSSRRPFELASAPPDLEGDPDDSSDDDTGGQSSSSRRSRLDGPRIASSLVAAIAAWPAAESTSLLRSLALVSPAYRDAAQAVLFHRITVSSSEQLQRCVSGLAKNPRLGLAVHDLTLHTRDGNPKARKQVLQNSRALLRCVPNLRVFDEELFKGDFDITDLEKDYFLSSTTGVCLRSFHSRGPWWEISAIHALLSTQPELEVLEVSGAIVDREWAGARLLEEPTTSVSRLRRLRVGQILHEDTLAVLFRLCGGPGSRLEDVGLGFQSIDRDTPRASITSAFKSVRDALRQLTISTPTEATEDLSGFLDEIVAELPALEKLEWNEGAGSMRVPIASSRFLDHLPSTLKSLRARSLVSLSTSKVLAWLESDEVGSDLKHIDLDWASGRGDEEGREPWYRERHISRIQDAAEQVGVECKLSKGGATV